MTRRDLFLLPGGWTGSVRSSALHAVSIAFMALTRAWGSGSTGRGRTTRLLAELNRANTEIALLEEELSIKDARWSRIAARRRPYYRLVQLPEPVNKFSEFVGHLVRWLESICPTMGKVRIAQVLARAGWRLGATTVGRMLKETGPLDEADDVAVTEAGGSEPKSPLRS